MKRIMLLVGFLLLTSPLLALDSPAISTNTPQAIQAVADGLHILDNVTPATFWDWSNGEWLAGGTTVIAKKYYVSLDAGVVASISNSQDHKGQALYMGGLRFHAGELMVDKLDWMKTVANHDLITAGLLKYATAGVWGARDWDAGKWRSGIYTGFEFSF